MQEKLEQLLEQLSKVPAQQKWGGLALAVFALIGLHYYFIYMDQETQLKSSRAEYNRLDLERTEKENYAQNLALYESKLNELKRQLNKAQSLLPDSKEVAGLLSNLSTLGERIGLTIDRFEPQKEILHDFYASIPFKMKVKGNYHDIAMFIDAIGRMDRIVNVSQLSMQTPKVINKKIVVESEFQITTFRFLEKGETGASGKKKKRRRKRRKRKKKKKKK